MTATNPHKMTRGEDGEYEYRGKTIYRDDSVSSGYWGRWWIAATKGQPRFSTLAEAKAFIDQRKDGQS